MALAGRRIVNTRAVHQAEELSTRLAELGAEPVAYPCIAIAPPEDTSRLDRGIEMLAKGEMDWLLLTSSNAVHALADRLEALHLSIPKHALKVAAIGPATAHAARQVLDVEVTLLPEKYVAESLAETLAPKAGTRIFLPQSEIARPVLAQSLIAAGAAVLAVDAYRTVRGSGGEDVPGMLADRRLDAITFTSSSTVQNFVDRLLDEDGSLDDLDGVCLACIGPVTAETLHEMGLHEQVMPEAYTMEGLVDALESYFKALSNEKE